MSAVIQIRTMKLGEGIPKICIPLTDKTTEGLAQSLRDLNGVPVDFADWRADFFDGIEQPGKRLEALRCLRDGLGEHPLLFTLRTSAEMGMANIHTDQYLAINRSVIDSGLADIVDIELSQGEQAFCTLVQYAHEADMRVIASCHNFCSTPDRETIVETMRLMQKLGADVAKYAVMPKCSRDVLTLLDATLTMRETYPETPVITMSMGAQGAVSRVCGSIFGSCATFGTAGKASAPGQLPAADLARFLELLHPSHS